MSLRTHPADPDRFADQIRSCARRIAESGPPALAGLYDLTAGRLLRYSLSITRHQHDAEDALQAALLSVADHPQMLERSDRPWAYLLRITRNESLVILRRKRRCLLSDDLQDLRTQVQVDELEREETFREVWRALRRLPATQGEVVVLKIWESMTFAEIGDVLEVSPATAASRYRYAMEKLSHRLRPLVTGAVGDWAGAESPARATDGATEGATERGPEDA